MRLLFVFGILLILFYLTNNVISSKYIVATENMAHYEAKEFCENLGYDLPSLTSLKSNEEITLKAEELLLENIWINAKIPNGDQWSKNGFRMGTNEPVTTSLWAKEAHQNKENCVGFDLDVGIDFEYGNLRDIACDKNIFTICTKYDQYNGWKYIVGNEVIGYTSSRRYCEYYGFELPSLSSLKKSIELFEKFNEFGYNEVWINAKIPDNDKWSKDAFRMKGNINVLLGLWDDGQPNNRTGNELCVEMNRKKFPAKRFGNLNNVNCNEPKSVLCVKYD